MKINPIFNPNILRNYQQASQVTAKPDVPASRDEVVVSDEAMSFSKILAEAKESIEARTPEEKVRIEEIKLAVRQGTYRIDSDKIAEKILESIQKK